jgi:IS1 family transposase
MLLKAPKFLKLPKLMNFTFAGSKKKKVWIWSAIDHGHQGILSWVIGDTPGRSQ